MVALAVRGLVKRYGANMALDGVDLDIPAGELHAVIGPNGAGKSTLFGAISGEFEPSAGTIALDGSDVTALAAFERVRRGIARAFQVARIFPALTVRENVEAAILARSGQAMQFWRAIPDAVRERAGGALVTVGLDPLATRAAGSLSQGDRKRLEIGIALELDARLLLLDEPTAGMSPQETQATVELIEQIWRRGNLTIVLTEHDMGVVFRLAQTLTVLHRGRILCSGAPAEIRAREDVRDVYLGRA